MEVADADADELVVTVDMRDRKGRMDAAADGFLALPGGIGTLEELLEIWVGSTIGIHRKPVVVLDPAGVYAPLHDLVERLTAQGFVRPEAARAVTWERDVGDALDALESGLGGAAPGAAPAAAVRGGRGDPRGGAVEQPAPRSRCVCPAWHGVRGVRDDAPVSLPPPSLPLRLGGREFAAGRAARDGDRQPDAGLLLQRRAAVRPRAGGGRRRAGRRGGRRPRRHRRRPGRSRPGRRRGRGAAARRAVRRRHARRAPEPADQRRHVARGGRGGGVRGRRRAGQRHVGRSRPAAARRRREVRRRPRLLAHRRRGAAHAAAPGVVRPDRRRPSSTRC